METIGELLEAIKLGITERVTSPLLGSYIISWLVWNFDFILISFSDEKVETKIAMIHAQLFSDWYVIVESILVPAAATFFLIYVYPYPAKWVYQHRLIVQRQLGAIRQRIEEEQLLSVEQSRQIRLNYYELQKQNREKLASVEQENADLRKQLDAAKGQNNAYSALQPAKDDTTPEVENAVSNDAVAISDNAFKLNEPSETVLSVFASDDVDSLYESDIFAKTKNALSKTRAKYALQYLSQNGYLSSDKGQRGTFYYLMSGGREYIVNHNMDIPKKK